MNKRLALLAMMIGAGQAPARVPKRKVKLRTCALQECENIEEKPGEFKGGFCSKECLMKSREKK